MHRLNEASQVPDGSQYGIEHLPLLVLQVDDVLLDAMRFALRSLDEVIGSELRFFENHL